MVHWLLAFAKVRITDREYWAQRKSQAKLDKENAEKIAAGVNPSDIKQAKYQTDKDFLRDAIKAVLSDSRSYEDFCRKLFENYGFSVHESRGRISYILADREKPIRDRQLGTDFERDHIYKIIAENVTAHPTEKYHSSVWLITDLEACIKAQQNKRYAEKVKIGNLQKMADTLAFLRTNNIESVDILEQLLSSTSADVRVKHSALKTTEAQLTKVNLLIKNTGQYLANKDIYRQYLNSKNKKQFREVHRTELTLYEAARKYLQENATENIPDRPAKPKFKVPSLKELKEQKAELMTFKNQQYEEYSFARAKYRELQTVQSNLSTILQSEQFKQKSKEQSL